MCEIRKFNNTNRKAKKVMPYGWFEAMINLPWVYQHLFLSEIFQILHQQFGCG